MVPSRIRRSDALRDQPGSARLRWIARLYAAIVGGLTVAFLGVQFIGELFGQGDPYQVEDPTTAELIALTALAIAGAGLLLGWWRERLGAAIALFGGLVSLVLGPVAGPVALLLILGGGFLVATWLLAHNNADRESVED